MKKLFLLLVLFVSITIANARICIDLPTKNVTLTKVIATPTMETPNPNINFVKNWTITNFGDTSLAILENTLKANEYNTNTSLLIVHTTENLTIDLEFRILSNSITIFIRDKDDIYSDYDKSLSTQILKQFQRDCEIYLKKLDNK